MRCESNPRFYTIDIFRGLAAISVLLSHLINWTGEYQNNLTKFFLNILVIPLDLVWRAGGTHPGVVVFIVLSGFCIHLSVAKNKDLIQKKYFWKNYCIRRSFRIYPIYWTGLIIGIMVVLASVPEKIFNFNSYISFFITFAGVAEVFKFTGLLDSLYLGNAPLSTVGVEILLYASYPFYLKLTSLGTRYLLLFMLICYLIFVGMVYINFQNGISLASYFEFAPYWIWGAICAEIYANHMNKLFFNKILVWTVLVLTIFYTLVIFLIKVRGLYLFSTPLLALISGLVLAIILDKEKKQRLNLSRFKFISAVGERGYSIYAIHTPIIFLMLWILRYSEFDTWLYFWVVLTAVIIVSEFCYRNIEIPSHRLAKILGQ